ncbi:hypothetical protein HAX54_013757 [Datura stramonium]|uniref:Uncharacterized protein n=1 Tax=Datura stramonium TaxID=4076 RepID=A0ABS8TNN1_DATST|nr:hypothetical protein [Datura stramonium]
MAYHNARTIDLHQEVKVMVLKCPRLRKSLMYTLRKTGKNVKVIKIPYFGIPMLASKKAACNTVIARVIAASCMTSCGSDAHHARVIAQGGASCGGSHLAPFLLVYFEVQQFLHAALLVAQAWQCNVTCIDLGLFIQLLHIHSKGLKYIQIHHF